MQNSSPWIKQLRADRVIQELKKDINTDVAIVGGGIAGVTTAYMTLKHTDRKVVLIEAWKLGHGATGHNAGQIVAEFERPSQDLIEEFGKEKTIEALRSIEIEAWSLLESIFQDTNLSVPYSTFLGYGGYSDFDLLAEELENILIHKENDLPYHQSYISKEAGIMQKLPSHLQPLCIEIPQEDISRILETTRKDFVAALVHPAKMGCLNSALFTEQLAEYCIEKYPDRFELYEQTKMERLVLGVESATIITKKHSVSAREIVLCTNGFEHFEIENTTGTEINTRFHHDLEGVAGYMTSFYDSESIPFDRWYFLPKNEMPPSMQDDAYYYITRRPFEAPLPFKGLVCVGGPEIKLTDRQLYNPESLIDNEVKEDLFKFTLNNIKGSDKFKHGTFWHGLMGYTKSKVRMIGYEPCNHVLLYNLGCNGVGILPSIYGARKISRHLNKEELKETIFDPGDHRCMLSPLPIDEEVPSATIVQKQT